MKYSFFKTLMVLGALMDSSSAFAGPTKVTQYLYVMDVRAYDSETGEKKSPPTDKLRVIRNAYVIKDVSYVSGDNTHLKIEVIRDCHGFSSNVYLEFRAPDSARILNELLTNGSESLFMLHFYDSALSVTACQLDVKADALYVWSDKTNSIMKVGELIGPQRSVEEQNYYEQLMVRLFGPSRLNKVNFIDLSNKPPTTTNL